MGNADLRKTKQMIYHSKSIDGSCPTNVVFIGFELLCQTVWAFFTMPTHLIWSCHMTQEANLEKILFWPNSTFNVGKSHKISS